MITLIRLTALGVQRVVHWVFGFDKADRPTLFESYPDVPATHMFYGAKR